MNKVVEINFQCINNVLGTSSENTLRNRLFL
jgi:hypothetical protein